MRTSYRPSASTSTSTSTSASAIAIAITLTLASLSPATLLGCSDAAASPDAGVDAGTPPPDAAPDAPPVVLTPCPAPSGPGTEHATEITADETWTAAASPHRVTYSIRLLATVRVEACATVLVDDGYRITIGTSGTPGALVAKGERGVDASGAPVRRPVTFAASAPAKPWGSIAVTADGRLDLESVLITDAANPTSDQNGGGAILAYGKGTDSGAVTTNVRAVDVTVERARGYGFNFQVLSGFTADSQDVVVKASGSAQAAFPIRLDIGAMATVPAGLGLAGNVADEVQLAAGNVGMLSDTIRARGAPYRVSGRIRVAPPADGAAATLTVEPGVTLRFDDTGSDNGIQLGSSAVRMGVLVAAGTPAAPITFTSAQAVPAPGDWKNIYFAYSPATGNRLSHAVIEYAGGPSGAQGYGCGPIENDASVLILAARPSDAFIDNTAFKNGGGDTGIVLGWTSDAAGPDFLATNTFTDMPACRVSRWQSATGPACPGGTPICF